MRSIMNDKPTRKYNRLKNFDYSSVGDYYITICTKNKQNFFGSTISKLIMLIAKITPHY